MKKQQESLKNMVYQAILNGIFTDEYKPNQIINEQELVQKFGCSKTPIREALVTLCNEGILRSFPRFGYQVVSVSREEAQNILDFRLVLEGGYLRQSIGNITEENLAAYAQFYWQTWSNVNPALDIAHHNDIMQSIREKDLEKTQNYLKEDLADFCG